MNGRKGTDMEFINRQQVESLLDMQSCISLMHETLINLAHGHAEQMLRTVLPLSEGNAFALMPAIDGTKSIAGAKLITVFPDNFGHGLPSHQGIVLVFDTQTGSLKAAADGEAITAIRTAAVSAVATDFLANDNASRLAIIGSGTQARMHLEAILCVRNIIRVCVWDINASAAKRFAGEMQAKFGIEVDVCQSTAQAICDSDIICTVTAATEPVVFGQDIKNGTHINAVGACKPSARELDTYAVQRGLIFTDKMESLLNESGDFIIPFEQNLITKNQIAGELGCALLGKIPGRQSPEDITIYKSLGLGVFDLVAANYISENI